MVFEREIRRSTLIVALLISASGGIAEPAEPLLVTVLRDPVLVPLSGNAGSSEQSLDDATQRFSRAVAQSIQSEQRTMEQACRSRATRNAAARFDWQAHCLYQRH